MIPEKHEPHPYITSLFGMQQIYHPVGNIKSEDKRYHFFIMCKIAAYKNCLLWLATETKDRIAGIHRIAPYYEALARKIIPTVHVSPPHISVKAEETVQYPLKKVRDFQIQYLVQPDGSIHRVD